MKIRKKVVATEGGDGKDEIERLGGLGWGGGVGLGGWYASEKGLYLENYWTKFKKWICFGISMNWGINLALKKVKKVKEEKLDFWQFGWNLPIFSKVWKIGKLGNEVKPKLFNLYIFVKRIKWARKWYNILINTSCNKKVIKLNNFENSKILLKSTLILVSTLPSHSLVWQYFKKIITWLLKAWNLVYHDTKNLYVLAW